VVKQRQPFHHGIQLLTMLIDTHCHLVHKKYNKTPEILVKEAKEDGIEKIISIGTNLKNSSEDLEELKSLESVYNTVGIYPHDDLDESEINLVKSLQKLIDSYEKVVGIGECGIDITDWNGGRDIEQQEKLFEMQVNLAVNNNLPLVIHNRNGDEQVLSMLDKYKGTNLTGVFHCFTSTWETAKKALDLGFYLSFTGIITYPTGKNIWETVEKTPLDKILVETDAPYLSPQGFRNQVNEPKYVKITAKTLANIKKISFAELSEATYKNSCQLFTRIA